MVRKIIKFFRRINPFVRTIKVVFLGASFERHGNCIDIKSGSEFTPPRYPCIIKVPLGFKAQLPKHYRGVLHLRSSSPLKYQISVPGSWGEIEWDYAEEWQGIIYTTKRTPCIERNTRLFQFHIEPLWDAPWYIKVLDLFSVYRFEEVEKLSTSRGGIGHTGN